MLLNKIRFCQLQANIAILILSNYIIEKEIVIYRKVSKYRILGLFKKMQ